MEHIAEVVVSSTSEFSAECRSPATVPHFGALVYADGDPKILGLVYEISTGSLEPNRRAKAYGKTPEELSLEHPEIMQLLTTEILVMTVGYLTDSGQIRHTRPPRPPAIHSFVYLCERDLICRFTEQHDYLRLLVNSSRQSVDDLIIAITRSAWLARNKDRNYLVKVGKELAHLLRDDFARLNSLLRRVVD